MATKTNNSTTEITNSRTEIGDTISRKKTLERLTNISYNLCKTEAEDKIIEYAKTMVITAEPETHEERTKTHACDCISRQDAIDTLSELPSAQPEIIHLQKEQAYMQGWEDGRKNLMEQLPSVLPEVAKDTNVPNTDCISRQAAIDAMGSMLRRKFGIGGDLAEITLAGLPPAQPEIIRCRDCKHWDKTWSNNWSPDYHYCPVIDKVRKGNFHCRYAERRTDG